MKGFRAGLKQGLRDEKRRRPLSKKEKQQLKRLLKKEALSEVIY